MGARFPKHFNIADRFLFDHVDGHPDDGDAGIADKTAIRYGEREYSYREVAERARALARYLATVGVAREQRIYTILPDTPPFAWSLFGTLACGAVVAAGNPKAPVENLAYAVEYSRAAVVVTLPAVAAALADALADSPDLRAVLLVPDTATGEDPERPAKIPPELADTEFAVLPLTAAVAAGRALDTPLPETDRDDVCMWLFAPRGDGKPTACMHTHAGIAFHTEAFAKATIGYRRDDITMSVPRLFLGYVTGTNLFFPFAVGATTVFHAERPTVQSLAKAIDRHRPTVLTNVPTMMGKLLDHDDERAASGEARLDLSGLRLQLSAGEALPADLCERFMERFGCEIYDGLGSAEMSHVYISNRPGDVKPGSAGKLVAGFSAAILPKTASGPGAVPVATGETGVLWIKGESVAVGYFLDRERTFRTLFGHWCRTGYLCRVDKDGYYWVSGRADDVLKLRGAWVVPVEVEECLIRHKAVEAAAVTVIDKAGTPFLEAVVVVRENARGRVASEDGRRELATALKAHLLAKLGKRCVPHEIGFVDEVPTDAQGRADRELLKERGAFSSAPDTPAPDKPTE